MNGKDIEKKIEGFNLDLPGDIIVLPSNFETVYSRDDLNYSLQEAKAIVYFNSKNINSAFNNVECEFETQLSAESEILNLVFNILITHADEVIITLITPLLCLCNRLSSIHVS